MALNLWKIGGQPTSMNPMISGGYFYTANINPSSTYRITIKAKSLSGAVLRLTEQGGSPLNQLWTLTSQFATYTMDLSVASNKWVGITDNNQKGDIIIDSIELVQKPLPKLTINGIDGFQSGKWTLHANATVADDETLVLNATADLQQCSITVKASPSTPYIIKCENSPNVQIMVNSMSDGVTGTLVNVIGNTLSFVSDTNADSLFIRLRNNGSSGTFTFKRPMLNLGSTPAPYSKKTGDKMVIPTPKNKNIASIKSFTTSVNRAIEIYNLNKYIGQQVTISLDLKSGNGNTYTLQNGDLRIGGGAGGIINMVDWFNGTLTGSFARFSKTVTVPSDGILSLWDRYYNGVPFIGDNIQVELGTTATPYTPYDVQVNRKPIFRKDVDYLTLDGSLDWIPYGGYSHAVGVRLNGDAPTLRDKTVQPISLLKDDGTAIVGGSTSTLVDVYSSTNWGNATGLIITISNSAFTGYTNDAPGIKQFFNDHPYQLLYKLKDRQMIDLPSYAVFPSSFKDYQPNLKKANTGLSFNGITDYLQLPSMTMDAIEIECLIDSVQNGSNMVVDCRTGVSNYLSTSGAIGWSNFYVDGVIKGSYADIPKNIRTKIKLTNNIPFTDNATFFANYSGTNNTKAILYKVTCYLANQIVAQYDFENPKNVVGTSVLQDAVNMIPSFEDSRWSIHANAKVMGKDILHLDATANFQTSTIDIPVLPNKDYSFSIGSVSSNTYIDWSEYDANGTRIVFVAAGGKRTVNSNTKTLRLTFGNLNIGSFDFIKPQLYQLDGKEGTINGSPIAQNKPSKRSLYSKR